MNSGYVLQIRLTHYYYVVNNQLAGYELWLKSEKKSLVSPRFFFSICHPLITIQHNLGRSLTGAFYAWRRFGVRSARIQILFLFTFCSLRVRVFFFSFYKRFAKRVSNKHVVVNIFVLHSDWSIKRRIPPINFQEFYEDDFNKKKKSTKNERLTLKVCSNRVHYT